MGLKEPSVSDASTQFTDEVAEAQRVQAACPRNSWFVRGREKELERRSSESTAQSLH